MGLLVHFRYLILVYFNLYVLSLEFGGCGGFKLCRSCMAHTLLNYKELKKDENQQLKYLIMQTLNMICLSLWFFLLCQLRR